MVNYLIPQRLDVSNAPEIEKELIQLADREKPDTLVCDFSRTTYISSAGLRVMLVMAKRMKAADAAFVLCNLQKPVREIFDLAGFDAILDIRDSMD